MMIAWAGGMHSEDKKQNWRRRKKNRIGEKEKKNGIGEGTELKIKEKKNGIGEGELKIKEKKNGIGEGSLRILVVY